MIPLTPDQQAVAQAIAENDRIIEQLRRQNEQLARLLPRTRGKVREYIEHPITKERVYFMGRGKK